MKTSLYKHIIGQLSAGFNYDVLVQEIHRLSASGLTRQELINCLNYVHSRYLPGDPYRNTVEAVLDGLYGWCLPQQELLHDEPLNQLAVFEWADPETWTAEFDYIPWDHLVHPDDLQEISNPFVSELFYIGQTDNEFTKIRQFDKMLRVRKEYLKIIAWEGFYIGDLVRSKEKSGDEMFKDAIITGMSYDHEIEKIAYQLSLSGNKKTGNPYYADEMESTWLLS